MAGRRAQAPRAVTVTSLAQTGDGQTDRVLWQAENAIQSLEDKTRAAKADTAAVSDHVATFAPISVKSFGAVGDGFTNDAPAINQATQAAAVAGNGVFGGRVYCPKGTYVVKVPVVIPNGVCLYGDGAATVIKLMDGVTANSVIQNEHQDGTQEFAFVESLIVDGNKGGGAVCTDAAVSWGGLFINSYIRDVIIQSASGVGLHVFTRNGMGPILIENTWLLHSGGHNILIEELGGNANACAGIYLLHVTSENWGTNCSAIYLKGVGSSGNYRLDNIHIEHGGTETGLTGITFDGVSHVRASSIQLQAGTPAHYTQGISITSAAQNVDIEIDNVTNINVINPVLVDSAYSATLAGININKYVTPDIVVSGGMRFAPATNNTGAGAPNVALVFQSLAGGNLYTASYPGLGGGVLRWSYTTGGDDIMQWGTDGTIFVYQPMTLQSGLLGFAHRAGPPSSGTHALGEIVFNADPVAGGFIGWVCVTAGTPGTWKSWGAVSP
jgi:hypothetical protein